jgi:hypothetical protein
LPVLQAALKKESSVDLRERLGKLVAELDSKQPPRGDDVRVIRGLAVLEHINTPASRKLIADIEIGMESARATQEAKESLERLR